MIGDGTIFYCDLNFILEFIQKHKDNVVTTAEVAKRSADQFLHC